jgi:hypothetical protein
MADINLSQAEADALIAVEKRRIDDKEWSFPSPWRENRDSYLIGR